MAGSDPRILLELVDTHRPEAPVIAANLPVLEFHVADDLDRLQHADPIPVSVIHNKPCPDSVCPDCGRRRSEGCWVCLICKKHSPVHRHRKNCRHQLDPSFPYPTCNCCHIARKHGRRPCYQLDRLIDDHRHCSSCHRIMDTDKQLLFDNCWKCNHPGQTRAPKTRPS